MASQALAGVSSFDDRDAVLDDVGAELGMKREFLVIGVTGSDTEILGDTVYYVQRRSDRAEWRVARDEERVGLLMKKRVMGWLANLSKPAFKHYREQVGLKGTRHERFTKDPKTSAEPVRQGLQLVAELLVEKLEPARVLSPFIIWRPGAESKGVVAATWAEVKDFVDLRRGDAEIIIDDSLASVTIEAIEAPVVVSGRNTLKITSSSTVIPGTPSDQAVERSNAEANRAAMTSEWALRSTPSGFMYWPSNRRADFLMRQ